MMKLRVLDTHLAASEPSAVGRGPGVSAEAFVMQRHRADDSCIAQVKRASGAYFTGLRGSPERTT